jgi:hypothetical protein
MADVQIAVIDQQNTQLALAAPEETHVNVAVPGVQGAKGDTGTVAAAGDGTAAAPGISFANDTNTGIYRPGTDQLAVSTGGTGRLFVDASGRIGIGASSPAQALDVKGAVRSSVGTGTGIGGAGYALYQFGASATATENWHIGSEGDGSFRFYNQTIGSGVERARITADGKVGVGISSPNTRLHVSDGEFTISTGTNSADSGGIINFGITTFPSFSPMATVQGLLANAAGTELQGGLGFFTRPLDVAGQSLQRRMTIKADGKVGIGTTTPGETLEVAGNIALSPNPGSFRVLGAGLSSDTTVVLQSGGASGTGGNIELERTGNILYDGTIHRFRTVDGTSEYARIDSSGRLLVGTSSYRSVGDSFLPSNVIFNEGSGISTYQVFSGVHNRADSVGPQIVLGKSRGETNGSVTIVQNNDTLGQIAFAGADGNNLESRAALITAIVDGTPGANDMPGRLVFATTADGASTPTERMRIKSTGIVNVGNTPVYADNAAAKTGGLVDGDIYRTSTGDLKIVYT